MWQETARVLFARFYFFFLFILLKGFAQDPEVLYLTWKSDPATTMTIMWHTATGKTFHPTVYYKRLDETSWQQAEGTSERLCRSNIEVHQLELKNLDEDTDYLFRLGDGELHRFRTLPNGLKRPVHVAVGGDAFFYKDLYEKMNREVASKSPDFVILAGDLAYVEGIRRALKTHYWKVNRWEEFFRIWSEQMVTKEGRMIPIVPVIGNHDVCQGFDHPQKRDVFFYQVFAFPEHGIPFRTLSIGSEVSFFLLDTAHTFPIAGAQTEWLRGALQSNRGADYKIPVYHLPAYPSESYFHSSRSKNIRKFWIPLFQEYGVKMSMEHDNHTFKRTFPIKDGMVDQDGIIFLGDGAWGVIPLKPKRHWYLAKASRTNNYWFLRITSEKIQARAFNNEGDLLDEVEVQSRSTNTIYQK